EADLSVQIAAAPASATVGQNVTYNVTVSNAGPCTASGIVLSNILSAGQVATTVTNGAAPGQACPFPGPVAWWRAEGNAHDGAGANNGALAGAVSFISGQVGQSFSFDGSSGSVAVP